MRYLGIIAATTLVLSVVQPGIVLAQDMSSFKGLDPSLVEKFEKLKQGGMFEGASGDAGETPSQLTRQQFAAIFAQLNLGNAPGTAPGMTFSDVSSPIFGQSAIEAAFRAGLLSGVSDPAFRPDGDMTREQMAALLARALGQAPSGGMTTISSADVSDWAAAYVEQALQSGLARTSPAAADTDLIRQQLADLARDLQLQQPTNTSDQQRRDDVLQQASTIPNNQVEATYSGSVQGVMGGASVEGTVNMQLGLGSSQRSLTTTMQIHDTLQPVIAGTLTFAGSIAPNQSSGATIGTLTSGQYGVSTLTSGSLNGGFMDPTGHQIFGVWNVAGSGITGVGSFDAAN